MVNSVNLHGMTPHRTRTHATPRSRSAAAFVAAALLATLLVTAAGVSPAQAATSVKVTNTTAVRCGFGNQSVPTDWYVPSTGTPKGLVWLQHGFTENKGNWATYAPKLAGAGYVVVVTTLPTINLFGCTVQNVGNNRPFLDNIAAVLGSAAGGSGALVTSYNNATSRAGRAGLALPSRWAFVGHSAGGEAVTYVANRLRTNHGAAFARLRGVVLEDPVNSFIGTNLADGLSGLNTTSLPVYALAAPPYSCNNNQSGVQLVTQRLTNRSFHGALVTSGTHVDIFGAAAGGLLTATCGTPLAKNISATHTLTTGWLADQIAGTRTPRFYPGGATYQALVSAGTITTLP